jgi:hypothetical protein
LGKLVTKSRLMGCDRDVSRLTGKPQVTVVIRRYTHSESGPGPLGSRSMSVIAMFQQELQADSSLRLLFADEFRLILAVFCYRKIILELRGGRAQWF